MGKASWAVLVGISFFAARAGCRAAVHAAGSDSSIPRAPTVEMPEQPAAVAPSQQRPPRLLRYQDYIAWDGRRCWLNRADEQVCEQ